MPLSALYEARLNKPRKSGGGPGRPPGSSRDSNYTPRRGRAGSSGDLVEMLRRNRTISPRASSTGLNGSLSGPNGGSSSLRGTPLASSSTAPNLSALAGSTSGTPAPADKPKKKRRKFKGYAMVIEDDFGNVIEERPWGEPTPEPEPIPQPPADPPKEPAELKTEDMEVDELDDDDGDGDVHVALMSRSASVQGPLGASKAIASRNGSHRAASSRRLSSSSRLSELTMPLSEIETVSVKSVPESSRPRDHGDKHKRPPEDSSSPLPDDVDMPFPEVTSDSPDDVPLFTRKQKPPKKRRKTSPFSSPEYDPSRPGSAVASSSIHPHATNAASAKATHKKAARVSLPVGTLGTARSLANAAAAREKEGLAQSAKGLRDSAALGSAPPPSARPTSAVPSAGLAPAQADSNDVVLPPVPRVGMGEAFPVPPESDLRTEALFIIESGRKKREQREKEELEERKRREKEDRLAKRNGRPNGSTGESSRLTPPPSGENSQQREARNRPNGHVRSGGDEDEEDVFAAAGPSSAARRASQLPTPAEPVDFDTRFAAIQRQYEDRSTIEEAGIFTTLERADDPRPPKFHYGQRPTVVLAPPAQGPGSIPVRRVKDKLEREYSEGYEGLQQEHEADLRRFADNVRTNLIEMADWYFPVPGARRDALLEAAGRLLSGFGLHLTTDGEGALQRPLSASRPTNDDDG